MIRVLNARVTFGTRYNRADFKAEIIIIIILR